MSQKYKSVYFPDYPADSPRKRNLTLGDKYYQAELTGDNFVKSDGAV